MMTDWCYSGQHDDCPREWERFYFEVVRGKTKIVWTGEKRVCQCNKRGCKCHVPAKDRLKPPARRKRKK
jgi:hypothetical protein